MSALSQLSIAIEVDLAFSQLFKAGEMIAIHGPVLYMVPDRCAAVRVHRLQIACTLQIDRTTTHEKLYPCVEMTCGVKSHVSQT